MELSKRRNRLPSRIWNIFPRPLPEALGFDLLYLVQLLILQDFVLPQILGNKVFIDLLTPWLVIVFVFRNPLRIFTLGFFAVLFLETHSGLPRGLFACLYWVLGVSLYYIRHHISWASFLPWGVVFCVCQLLVLVLEFLAYWTQNFSPLSFISGSFFLSLFNSLLSCAFGLFIIYKFRLDTLEEHRLARR